MRQIPLDTVFSRIFRRNKKRAVPTEPTEPVHTTPPPPDDPPTPIAEPAPTASTSVDSDVPQSPQSDNSVNVATLEFAASRDLATFLEHDWPSVKQNDRLEFPAFEYLLHQRKVATPEPPEDQRPSTSSGRSRPVFGTLPKKPKHLSLNRPKSAIAMIKRVRSTPNFRQT
ncbi:hypothetical protein BJV82DRAFT_669865 [Fennellomyces sp. T-0311]|nr:hypothetical protein BJV82DRAFT_669865 [Fennellomyces sp. T-0311]